MQVSKLVRENLTIDSQSYRDLSPVMKEAVSDVFKLIEKSTGDIIKNHKINIIELNNYFDKEIKEQLEGK